MVIIVFMVFMRVEDCSQEILFLHYTYIHVYTCIHINMLHGEVLAEIVVVGRVNGIGRKSSSQGDQKGRRSKHPLIPGSDDVINANDVISPPKTYIRRYKSDQKPKRED